MSQREFRETIKMMRKQITTVCALVSTFLLCCPVTGAMAVDALPKQILVFGGNGMIGSATMERLIPAGDGDDKYVLVNRGNWYWDSAFTIRPHVRHIMCDRMNKLENCPELTDYVNSLTYIDTIIDFSAYHPHCMSEALSLLRGKAKLYIYMSTDSVYEVCDKTHSHLTREEDAVRPTTEEKQEQLNESEGYGHRKLQCEEVLRNHRQEKSGPPYILLRLPDVVGPRDNTYRWWIYQLWMKLAPYLEKPFSIPSAIASQAMSLVYVNDVADLIVKLVHSPPDDALDQSFNLALSETPTLSEFVNGMKKELNLTDLKILEENSDTFRLFPSVHLGPVNISKAEKILNWKPTDWPTVLKETILFYESAIKQVYLDKPKRDIIQTMQSYFTSKPYDVVRGLSNVYGLSFAKRKDEL